MAVQELTIKLIEGVTYNNPNIGIIKDDRPKGVSLKKDGTDNIPYEQIGKIKTDLESGKIVIVGIVDDEMGVVGIPSKNGESGRVVGPAAAKRELEHEIKHNIRSEPNALVKIKEDRFNPESKDQLIESIEGETHEETQSRVHEELNGKKSQQMKDEVQQVADSKKVQKSVDGRNANQELKDEIKDTKAGETAGETIDLNNTEKETTSTEAPSPADNGEASTEAPPLADSGEASTEAPPSASADAGVGASKKDGEKVTVPADENDENMGW